MTKSSKLVFLLLTVFLLSAPILYSQNELTGANENITESYQQLKDNEKKTKSSQIHQVGAAAQQLFEQAEAINKNGVAIQ
jgi:hypothetical protein